MGEAEKAWVEYAVGGEHGSGPVTYKGAFMAGRESLRSRIAALEAENEKLQKVARASVRRLEKAAQYCGDPQHPIWDGGRVSEKARQRVEGLLDILDPFRPELEDVADDDWDRVYKLDPIDGYVSDFEERMEARAFIAESELNALRVQLDSTVPSVVLDGMIREAKAEALEEAASPTGGYREWVEKRIRVGSIEWSVWLRERAAAYRNGDA